MRPLASVWLLCIATLIVAAGGLDVPAAAAEIPKEYQLKAAFLYNFTWYIEWPAARFAAPDSPIVIGVCGRNPFGDELEKVVAGRKVGARPLEVRLVTTWEEAVATHLLFIPAGEEELLAAHAPQLDAAGVVTVGESERFAAVGGTIAFVVQGDRLRFSIHDVSDHAGVRISSQLLKLATAVHR